MDRKQPMNQEEWTTLADEVLMKAMRAAGVAKGVMVTTKWKDSIGIDQPSYYARRFAEEILRAQADSVSTPAQVGETIEQIVQQVKEACAQVADRTAERLCGLTTDYNAVRQVAKSIRALIPSPKRTSDGMRAALVQIANARMIDIRGAQEIARAALSSTSSTDTSPKKDRRNA